MLLVKLVLILLLGAIVISLFSGLFFLVKDKGQTNRTANALSVRIGLSIVAIVIVLIAGLTGVLEMNPDPRTGLGGTEASVGAESETGEAPSDEGSGRRRIEQP